MRRIGDQPSMRRVATSSEKKPQLSSPASIHLSLANEAETKEEQPRKPEYWILKEISDGFIRIVNSVEKEQHLNLTTLIKELQATVDTEIEKLLRTRKYFAGKNQSKSNQDENYVIFKSVEKLDELSDTIYIRRLCADIYLLMGDLVNAQTQYKKRSNILPLPVYLRLVQAELANKAGNDTAVNSYCNEIIKSEDKRYCADAYYLLAENYFKSGNFADAKTNIRLALEAKKDPNNISCEQRTMEKYNELKTNIEVTEEKAVNDSWLGKSNKNNKNSGVVRSSSAENPLPHLRDESDSNFSKCSLQ